MRIDFFFKLAGSESDTEPKSWKSNKLIAESGMKLGCRVSFISPCNYELFVKQSLNMEMAIVMAREAGIDWILHLDTDELMHPAGAREYSLRQLLSEVPANVDMVVFPNYVEPF